MKKVAVLLLFVLIPFFSIPTPVFAVGSGGFENASFSAKALGHANAVAAQADEPAAISYNPAGINQLPGLQVQTNVNFLSIFTWYSSVVQDDMRSSGTIVPVPTAYLTLNPGEILGNRVAFGIGSDSPFGLMNKYDSSHGSVRYTGWRNWFKMYTIKPIVSVKLFEWLSVAAGPMWYNVYDWGAIVGYPNNLVVTGAPDGQLRLNLSGAHWGWNAGVLAKPHKKHSFGFYFRSPVTVNTKGLAKVENSLAVPVTGAIVPGFETGASAKVDLPLNMTFAYAFHPTDRTTLEADFGFTRWAVHKRIFVHTVTINNIDDAILGALGRGDKDYKNGYSIHLGGNHKITDKITLMAGSLYYSNSVPKDHFIPAVPDGHRIGYSIGSIVKVGKYLDIGLMYLNIWVLARRIENGIAGPRVDGNYRTYIQELTLSGTYKWDDFFDRFKRVDDSTQAQVSTPPEAPTA